MAQEPQTDRRRAPITGLEGEIIESTFIERGDEGYQHSLTNLQIQMIGIGGAIGVGLFLGVGARLRSAGPGLVFSYVAVGVIVYLLTRALGEMVLYRPTRARSSRTPESLSATGSRTSPGGST